MKGKNEQLDIGIKEINQLLLGKYNMDYAYKIYTYVATMYHISEKRGQNEFLERVHNNPDISISTDEAIIIYKYLQKKYNS